MGSECLMVLSESVLLLELADMIAEERDKEERGVRRRRGNKTTISQATLYIEGKANPDMSLHVARLPTGWPGS